MACSKETQLKNVTLEVKHLEAGAEADNRLPSTVATITLNAAAAAGDTSINVTSDIAIDLRVGTSITFSDASGRYTALVRQAVSLGATTPADVTVAPLFSAIADSVNDATLFDGMVPLRGIQNFSFSNQDQEVDTTTVDSGAGTESALVRAGRNYTIDGIAQPGDRGLYDVIQPIALDEGQLGCEVYAIITLPDGERFRGAAKIFNYGQAGNQNEVKKYSFELRFQGSSFVHDRAYLFA